MARTPPTEQGPYIPPAPAFTTCACGALVSTQVWVHGTKEAGGHWRQLPAAVTALLGNVHTCARTGDERVAAAGPVRASGAVA